MGIALDPELRHQRPRLPALHPQDLRPRSRATASRASPPRPANPDVAVVDGSRGNPVEMLLFEMTNQGSANAHNSMPMLFGADGKLWVTTGENNVGTNAQNTTHTGGKILRMNPDGTPAAGQSAVQQQQPGGEAAVGQGPAQSLDPGPRSGRPTGSSSTTWAAWKAARPIPTNQPWEEANNVPLTTTTLLDYGWPNQEGIGPNIVHRYANGPGNDGNDCAIVGGTFYRSTGQPLLVPGARTTASTSSAITAAAGSATWPTNQQTPPPAPRVPTTTATGFATNLGAALLDLQVHPDGSLYYIARATVVRDHDAPGVIGRIRPTSRAGAQRLHHRAPGRRRLRRAGQLPVWRHRQRRGRHPHQGRVLLQRGQGRRGHQRPLPAAMSGLPQGEYRLTAKATNSLGGSKESDAVTVTVDGPTAGIDLPDARRHLRGRASRSASRAAAPIPQDGALPASSLEWNVLLHHNSHAHPAAGPFTGVQRLVHPQPRRRDRPRRLLRHLSHGDRLGRAASTPPSGRAAHQATLTLATAPPALDVYLDGSPRPLPTPSWATRG